MLRGRSAADLWGSAPKLQATAPKRVKTEHATWTATFDTVTSLDSNYQVPVFVSAASRTCVDVSVPRNYHTCLVHSLLRCADITGALSIFPLSPFHTVYALIAACLRRCTSMSRHAHPSHSSGPIILRPLVSTLTTLMQICVYSSACTPIAFYPALSSSIHPYPTASSLMHAVLPRWPGIHTHSIISCPIMLYSSVSNLANPHSCRCAG